MKDDESILVDLYASEKLTTGECETGLILLTHLKTILLDAESKHYTDVGLKYSKGFIAQIVLNMIPMMGHNCNLRCYTMILNMKCEGTYVPLGDVKFDVLAETTHEFIVTLTEQDTPRWHFYVPRFLRFLIKGPVELSTNFIIRKRAATRF